MSEYFRTKTHQFVDTELVMVVRQHCGTPEQWNENRKFGPLSGAIQYVKSRGWHMPPEEFIIIKLDCIAPFLIDDSKEVN